MIINIIKYSYYITLKIIFFIFLYFIFSENQINTDVQAGGPYINEEDKSGNTIKYVLSIKINLVKTY